MTDKPRSPSRTADQFIVRFPEGMRDRIAEVAKQKGRSMNAEIVARLEESLVTSSNPNIVATVARLGIALAFKESEKVASQMRATVLASYVRSYGRQLLPFIANSNPEMAEEVQRALHEADRIFEERHQVGDNLAAAAESIQKALAHVARLVDVDHTNPELEQLLHESQQLGDLPK